MAGLQRLAERNREISDDEFRVLKMFVERAGRFQFRRGTKGQHAGKALPPLRLVRFVHGWLPGVFHNFHIPKLRTSDCTTSDQPSTSTNNKSFSGSEIVIGGIIIMPMLISTVATTISIKMNGT